MNAIIDQYLLDGCMRCPLGGSSRCKVHRWKEELVMLRRCKPSKCSGIDILHIADVQLIRLRQSITKHLFSSLFKTPISDSSQMFYAQYNQRLSHF